MLADKMEVANIAGSTLLFNGTLTTRDLRDLRRSRLAFCKAQRCSVQVRFELRQILLARDLTQRNRAYRRDPGRLHEEVRQRKPSARCSSKPVESETCGSSSCDAQN